MMILLLGLIPGAHHPQGGEYAGVKTDDLGAPVSAQRMEDGAYLVEAPAYDLVVNPDGNVRSLDVGGTPLIGVGPDGKSGAFFVGANNEVTGFSKVEMRGANELVCVEDTTEVRYLFFADRIEMVRSRAGDRYRNWVWVPSAHITRSVDAPHDGVIDLIEKPFDGYQASPRWFTDSGAVVYMPYLTWQSRAEILADRNVAVLSRGYGEGEKTPFVIRPVPQPEPQDALVFDIQCEDPNFMLPGGEPIRFPSRVENISRRAVDVSARFRLLTFLDREPVATACYDVQLAPGKSQALPLSGGVKEPGVYRAELTLLKDDSSLRTIEWVFSYDWENWKVPLTRPADFEEFWEKTLQKLRSRALDAALTPQPDKGGHKVYKVNFRSLGQGRCYGWYLVPKGEGPFPALLMLPGNGVYKMPIYMVHGRYALLVIQVHGYDVDLSNFPSESPWKSGDYWGEWDSREAAYARVVYANCVRAVDFLMSRSEVDKEAVCVTGGSQGGGLSIVTAALEPRLKAALVEYPGLCKIDWLYRWFLDAPFPWNGHDPRPQGMPEEAFLKILSYYDPANFAPDIRCPVNASIALQDSVTISGAALAALRGLKTPPTLVNGVWASHRADERTNQAHLDWIREVLMK